MAFWYGYGYGYIHGYPSKICGYGYGWEISYPRQPWLYYSIRISWSVNMSSGRCFCCNRPDVFWPNDTKTRDIV